jgi:hypothetical protein
LATCRRFQNQSLRNFPQPLMIQRRNGVIDDNCMCAWNAFHFSEETSYAEGALLSLTQDACFIRRARRIECHVEIVAASFTSFIETERDTTQI